MSANEKARVEAFTKELITALQDPATKARQTPAGWALLTGMGRWKLARHVAFLNRKLLDVASGRCKRLMIFMPPRHGKSDFVTVKFSSWFLGTFPDRRVIVTGYSDDFASDFGRQSRNLLEEFGEEVWGLNVDNTSKAANRWDISGHRGGMITAGANGRIVGKGAHLFIIDDPIKTPEQAASPTYQRKTYEWYQGAVRTRLEKGGAIIIILTRWNENDIAGKLLAEAKNGGEQWEVVEFPAICEKEEGDALGRKKGEPLWPQKYDEAALDAIRKAVGPYVWNAQYQQHPSPLEGGFFKKAWFRYFDTKIVREGEVEHTVFELKTGDDTTPIKRIPKEKCVIFFTVDTASKTSQRNDYTAIGVFAMTPDKELLLLDMFRERIETTQHGRVLREMHTKWKPKYIAVEDKNSGTNVIQALKSELNVRPLKEKADSDKQVRAYPVSVRFSNGLVYFSSSLDKETAAALEDELLNFPNGEHDDMVDVIAYAGIEAMAKRKMNIGLPPGVTEEMLMRGVM